MTGIINLPERRVQLTGVSWEAYLAIMGEDEHDGRFAYDEGVLEIMTVGPEHEFIKALLARLLEHYTYIRGIDIRAAGNFTMLRKDLEKGIEADACYYIQSGDQLQNPREIKLPRDPPPDLAIEVDITNPTLDKLRIYAAIGVGELWVYKNDHVEVMTRKDEASYERVAASVALPGFPMDAFETALEQQEKGWSDNQILRAFEESLDQ